MYLMQDLSFREVCEKNNNELMVRTNQLVFY